MVLNYRVNFYHVGSLYYDSIVFGLQNVILTYLHQHTVPKFFILFYII